MRGAWFDENSNINIDNSILRYLTIKYKKLNLEKEYHEEVESGMVKVIPIPDIESVNYGRGVGYEINEFEPPKDIGKISATEIRQNLKK